MANQYTTVGGTTQVHDQNGNLSDDGAQLYAYDFQNRLVRVTNKATSAVIATYKYDALGRRVEKAVVGGATTRYILAGPEVVEEFDGLNVWQARYVYEDGIDQPRSMDRADIADVNGNSNTAEVLRFHYHQQALGSVTEMTQPSGAVVEWVVYDVYGQPTVRSQTGGIVGQSAVGNPFLFTGREFDAESGLFFYRARHYDPATGRFLQRDPLGFVDGLGLREYVRSSPATLGDPSGLRSAPRRRVDGRAPEVVRELFKRAEWRESQDEYEVVSDGTYYADPNTGDWGYVRKGFRTGPLRPWGPVAAPLRAAPTAPPPPSGRSIPWGTGLRTGRRANDRSRIGRVSPANAARAARQVSGAPSRGGGSSLPIPGWLSDPRKLPGFLPRPGTNLFKPIGEGRGVRRVPGTVLEVDLGSDWRLQLLGPDLDVGLPALSDPLGWLDKVNPYPFGVGLRKGPAGFGLWVNEDGTVTAGVGLKVDMSVRRSTCASVAGQ